MNRDEIDVAQTLINQSTYAVFDYDKDDILSHFECQHCRKDTRDNHDKDCVILKALKIVNKPGERRKEHRAIITNGLNDRVKKRSGEMALKWIRSEAKTQKYREVV